MPPRKVQPKGTAPTPYTTTHLLGAGAPASCTVCSVSLSATHPLRLEGVCSTACLKADTPRRARYQDPNLRP